MFLLKVFKKEFVQINLKKSFIDEVRDVFLVVGDIPFVGKIG